MRSYKEIVAEMERVGGKGLTDPELWNWFMALGWALGAEGKMKVSELLDKYCK